MDLPDVFASELVKCRTDAEVKQLGIEWTTAQARELQAKKVPSLHFYTMGRSEAVSAVARQLF